MISTGASAGPCVGRPAAVGDLLPRRLERDPHGRFRPEANPERARAPPRVRPCDEERADRPAHLVERRALHPVLVRLVPRRDVARRSPARPSPRSPASTSAVAVDPRAAASSSISVSPTSWSSAVRRASYSACDELHAAEAAGGLLERQLVDLGQRERRATRRWPRHRRALFCRACWADEEHAASRQTRRPRTHRCLTYSDVADARLG